MKKILAIHGIIGSGKDTVTTFIKMHLMMYQLTFHKQNANPTNWLATAIEQINNSTWGLDVINIHFERFAAPLKAIIASFLGCKNSDLNDQTFKKQRLNPEIWYAPQKPELTIRDLHCDISDGIKAALNEEIFATTCLERCKHVQADLVIINDLRYPFEMKQCIQNGVYTIKVQRPEADKARQEQLERNGIVHSSEQELRTEDFDYLIRNDSTFADLSIRIADVLVDLQLVTNDYVSWYKKCLAT